MDNSPCIRYFQEPVLTQQRHYEALRAFFLEGCSLHEVAHRFGYTYHTAQSLVRDFRRHCRTGQPPPFFS